MKVRWNANWRTKPHPYWFRARYPRGSWTVQLFGLEVFGGGRR